MKEEYTDKRNVLKYNSEVLVCTWVVPVLLLAILMKVIFYSAALQNSLSYWLVSGRNKHMIHLFFFVVFGLVGCNNIMIVFT